MTQVGTQRSSNFPEVVQKERKMRAILDSLGVGPQGKMSWGCLGALSGARTVGGPEAAVGIERGPRALAPALSTLMLSSSGNRNPPKSLGVEGETRESVPGAREGVFEDRRIPSANRSKLGALPTAVPSEFFLSSLASF